MLSSVDSLDLVYVPTSLLLLLRGYSDLIELKICKNNENGRDAQPVQSEVDKQSCNRKSLKLFSDILHCMPIIIDWSVKC